MKKCLIVVDFQFDFVSGALGFEGAEALEAPIAAKIAEYRRKGAEIIFTLDTHCENYLDTLEGRLLPVKHCIKNTDGHRLFGKIAELTADGDRFFYKPTFGSAELFDYLRSGEYESIELCGLVSNICVISNAVLARTAQPEARIIIDSACTASNDGELNNCALKVMKSLLCEVKAEYLGT